jgi:cephalosporin hydroxylase
MKIEIDTNKNTLSVTSDEGSGVSLPLYSDEAFDVLSRWWVKVGWDRRYSYTFSWMGRPIIQLPEDMIRMQEVFHQVRPTLVVETGVAHGGSLIFYASLLKAMDIPGRVVGIDVEVREENRRAIEDHPLASFIELEIGSSVGAELVSRVAARRKADDRVLVILDSDHSYAHVAAELEAYHGLVTPGSYIVATDGLMRDLHDVPRGQAGWERDNPACAAEDFASRHPEFVLEQPAWPFNESTLSRNVTHWPSAWLRRIA